MGCDIAVAGATEAEIAAIEQLFARRDRVFSRFAANTELNRVNGRAGRPTLVSADFADMVELALTAADQTDGLVDPTLGLALEAAGYDRDFALLVDDPRPPGAPAPSGLAGVRLHGRVLALPAGVRLDLSGVVKAQTVDDALAILGGNGFVSAGGDLAARGGLSVALPGGGAVHLLLGGLATSGSDRRRWRRARAVGAGDGLRTYLLRRRRRRQGRLPAGTRRAGLARWAWAARPVPDRRRCRGRQSIVAAVRR
jgi:thiamine biosynthesis lipoprotein ApbE